MNSGVYKIVNTVDGGFYIGSTKNFHKRWRQHFNSLKHNKHHSILFQQAYNKYGEEVFKLEIIEEIPYIDNKTSRQVLFQREQYWIEKLNAKELGYNIADSKFGDCISHHPLKQQIVARITKSVKQNISALTLTERKEKWGLKGAKNGMYGRHRTEQEKEHLRQCHLGKCYRPKGIKLSEETKRKLSEARKGKYTGSKNSFYGKHHSEETKQKLSELHKGKKPVNRRKVVADGLCFDSVYDCAKHFNVCSGTVIFRIKSKHWNWQYCN